MINMEDIKLFLKITFSSLFFCGLLFGFVYVIAYIERSQDLKAWNNGYCRCSGKWVYSNTSRSQNVTKYYFQCDKCNRILGLTTQCFVK